MLNILLVLATPLLLAFFASKVTRAHATPDYSPPLVPMVLLGYVLRALMFYAGNTVQFFSHQAGGDSKGYAYYAEVIVTIWSRAGVHWVDGEELLGMGSATLPPNLYALVALGNGGEVAREGCAALSALCCGVVALNLFSLCIELGAAPRRATTMAAGITFLPSLVLYSSDTYKDPMVWLLTFGMIGCTLRLLQRFNPRDVVIALICCWGLWYIRFYLLFLTALPLAVGLIGLNSKNPGRTLLVVVFGIALAVPLLTYTRVLGDFTDRANDTFDTSTSLAVRAGTAKVSGSGVLFDDGGKPTGALAQKLAYTLFAPFPWQAGSVGFHIGKIDAAFSTFILWRAIKGGRKLFRTQPSLLMALLTFAIPSTLAYAMTLNNIGTVLRQRIPIVLVLMVLASLSWANETEDETDTEDETEDDPDAIDDDDDSDVASERPDRLPIAIRHGAAHR